MHYRNHVSGSRFADAMRQRIKQEIEDKRIELHNSSMQVLCMKEGDVKGSNDTLNDEGKFKCQHAGVRSSLNIASNSERASVLRLLSGVKSSGSQ